MERETIVENALTAMNLADCSLAETQLRDWLQIHPQDVGLHEIAGALGIAKSAAMEREGEKVKPRQMPEALVSAK